MSENTNLKPTASGPNAEFKRVLLSQIRSSRNNPRKIIRQDMVDARAASMAEEGQTTPIIIRPLTPAELLNDGVLNEIVDGELRYRAALKNGDTHIDAIIEDISPLKAFRKGVSANRTNKPGWFEEYIDMEYLDKNDPNIQRQEIADLFETNNTTVSRGIRILGFLNETSRALVLQNLQKSTDSWQISENALFRLTTLGDPNTIEAALKVALNREMTEPEAKKLVEWVQAGNPPETYTGQKAAKTPKAKKDPGIPSEVADKLIELSEQVGFAKGRGEDPTLAQNELKAYRDSLTVTGKPLEPSHPITSPVGFALLKQAVRDRVGKLVQKAGNVEPVAGHGAAPQAKTSNSKSLKWFEKAAHWFVKIVWHWMIKNEHKVCKKLAHAIVPLHTSHSSGTHSGHSHNRSNSLSQGLMTFSLTILHGVVYTLLQFVFLWSAAMWFTSHWLTGLKPWVEIPFRVTARLALVDFPAWAWALALGHVVPAIVIAVLLFIGYSYAWNNQRARMTILGLCLFLFVYYGRRWSEVTVPNTETQQAQAQPTPVAQTKTETIISKIISHASPAIKKIATPVVAYQPSIAFNTAASPSDSSRVLTTLYDPKFVGMEIASVPGKGRVTAYAVSPDEGIRGDMAVSRLQNLTDPDKYTMMIGASPQKISSVNATTTYLTVSYKSADTIGGFLNGSGAVTYFWEDMKYIHTDEIDIQGGTPATVFQISLITDGAKEPFTVQCSTPENLKHIVSSFEYWIRASSLGRDTALAGMPYLTQGLGFNNDLVVDKLWAKSPMDLAGVALGEHLWSAGKITSEQQNKKELEAGLQSSAPVLYVVSPEEWNKAQIAVNSHMTNSFRPKLRKVILTILPF